MIFTSNTEKSFGKEEANRSYGLLECNRSQFRKEM